MRAITQALALNPVPGLFRDRHLIGAAIAATPVWAVMAVLWPDRPAGLPPLWPFLYLALITPALEEAAFRGALQGWCLDAPWGARKWLGFSAANWTASVLFTLVHFAYHPPAWALAVALPSLIFGHLRDRTGSVFPGFLLHAWYNAGYLLLIAAPSMA